MIGALVATLAAARTLWLVDPTGLDAPRLALLQSLQGLANRSGPLVWQKAGGMTRILLDQLQAEGWTFRETRDVWQAAEAFRSRIRGAVVCRAGDETLNVAATWAGLENLLVVDESLQQEALARGWKVLRDARSQLPPVSRLRRDLAVEQPPSKAGFLRDYAIRHRAECYWTGHDDAARSARTARLVPGAFVLGWGEDEFRWVEAISRRSGSGVAADWCANLSAMEQAGGSIRPMPKPRIERPPRKGERVVAFVLTDGDNIQWLTQGMPLHPSYYGHPRRGSFKMTWEVSPLLARFAPRVLDYLFAKATPGDGFVAAGAPGYAYPSLASDRTVYARQTAPLLRQTGLRVVGVIDDNGGSMESVVPLLELPEVDAVLYKAYSPYHKLGGRVLWHNGKPVVSYRFPLWEGVEGWGPDDLVRSVAAMSDDPTNPDSYALVTVHAWSFGSIGGPVEAVRRVVDRLPEGTRVVTAPELIEWLVRFCKPR
ncbi:MAG: GxGYxYP family putative glycoside hydrolase [Fimbriimonadales bacterium]|nr:GxGYxYP family putative glycoside hydrolase [Fimbriimonadales bacterium]